MNNTEVSPDRRGEESEKMKRQLEGTSTIQINGRMADLARLVFGLVSSIGRRRGDKKPRVFIIKFLSQ